MKRGKAWFIGLAIGILIGCLTSGTAFAVDLTVWENQWFRLTATDKGYSYEGSQFVSENEKTTVYLKIIDCHSDPNILKGTIYFKDEGQWLTVPDFNHRFIVGTALDFLCTFQAEMDGGIRGYAVRFTGKLGKDGLLSSATIKSLGGYYWETGEFARAGGFTVTGKWIPESKLPPDFPK